MEDNAAFVEVPIAPPLPTHVFIAQPVAQTYMPLPRAVAAGLAWRMMAINTGFGYAGTEGPPAGVHPVEYGYSDVAGAGYAMVSTETALQCVQDPSHIAQVLIAEWLQVYAALHVQGGIVNQSEVQWPKGEEHEYGEILVLETISEAAQALRTALEEGEDAAPLFIWTPQVMLQYVADWVGAVLPVHAALEGDSEAFIDAAQPFIALWPCLRPRGVLLRKLVAAGCTIGPRAFAAAADVVLGTHGGLLSTRIILLPVPPEVPVVDVPLDEATGDHETIPGALSFPGAITKFQSSVMLPRFVRVSVPILEDLLEGRTVGVLCGVGGQYTPLLSSGIALPPLLQMVLDAAAMTMVSILPGGHTSITGRHHLKDLDALRVSAAGLFYHQGAAAVAAMVTAFWDRFRDQHWARLHTQAPPSLLLRVPIHGVPLFPPSSEAPLHLYFAPTRFAAQVRHAAPLAAFLQAFRMKAGADGCLILLQRDIPVVHLRLDPKTQAHYIAEESAAGADQAPAPSPTTPSLTLPLLWSVAMTREDVLAIALSGPGAAAAFGALFELRIERMCHGRFVASTETIGTALATQALFLTGQGASLPKSTVLELVFEQEDLQLGQRLIQELQDKLTVRVSEVHGDSRTLVTNSQGVQSLETMVPMHGAVDEHTGEVELFPVPTVVPLEAVKAWTEPFLCGVVLAANSVSVAGCLGSKSVVDSLRRVCDACDPRVINDPALIKTVQEDKQRIRAALH